MEGPGRRPEVSDDEILREAYLYDDSWFVAKELVPGLDMSRQNVDLRLKDLVDEGLLETKKPGRDRMYSLTEDGSERAREFIRQL